MSEYKWDLETDKKHKIELKSHLICAEWMKSCAYSGQNAVFQIETSLVGHNAEIEITGNSRCGVSLGTINDVIKHNHYLGHFTLPAEFERGDSIYFEVSFPGNDIEGVSGDIVVLPIVGVQNLKWTKLESSKNCDDNICKEGEFYTLSAEVTNVEVKTPAAISIYEFDEGGAVNRLAKMPVTVEEPEDQADLANKKAKLVKILWEVDYQEDLSALPCREDVEKYGGKYQKPQYYFTVEIGSKEYGLKDQSSGLVERPVHSARVLEFEDILFRHNSAVMLPEPFDEFKGVPTGQAYISGISVIKTLLLFAYEFKEKKLLVAGHTDTSGGSKLNFKISQKRALSIVAMIENKKDDWVKIAKKHHVNKDIQHILTWAKCTPGTIDGEMGKKTTAATKRYQEACGIKVTGEFCTKTWEATFDRYQQLLTDLMELEQEGKAALDNRSSLQWAYSDKAVGCGETFPLEKAGKNNLRSQTNRRVEALFFDPEEVPEYVCKKGICKTEDCKIYQAGEFIRKYIEPNWVTGETVIIAVLDRSSKPVDKDVPYRITVGKTVRCGKTKDGGLIIEKNVPVIGIYDVKVEWGKMYQVEFGDMGTET